MRLKIEAHKVVVLAIVGIAFLLASTFQQTPQALTKEPGGLKFKPTYLEPATNEKPFSRVRTVHPDVNHIRGWISAVGAAVAIADIEGSGHPADICLVDARNDSVTIMPAPNTGARFAKFELKAPRDGYNPDIVAPMGCLPGDFNEDGNTDILVYYWGRTPVIFTRRGGKPLEAASFSPAPILPQTEIWNTCAVAYADFDGDGHADLAFGNYFRDGDRVLDRTAAHGAFEMQHSMSRAFNAGANRLFVWQRATSQGAAFRDASDAFTREMANGWTLAMAARDLDGDWIERSGGQLSQYSGLPELYIANDFGPDRLLLNRSTPGNPKFELVSGRRDAFTPRSYVLGRDSFKGMGVDFGNVAGVAAPVIAVSNISSKFALLESHFLFVPSGEHKAWLKGAAPYKNQSRSRGTWSNSWAWDIKFADLLNSGRPALIQTNGFIKGRRDRWPELHELAMGNDELLKRPASWPQMTETDDLSGRAHDRIYMQNDKGNFVDVWPSLGLDESTISRGIATGDVHGDGRLSLAIARQWEPSLFLENISAVTGRAIVLDLRLSGAVAGTRPAIGAEARVALEDGRTISGIVDGGSGHSGKRAPEIHLGLGNINEQLPMEVELRWRDESGAHYAAVDLRPGRHRLVLGIDVLPQTTFYANKQPSDQRVTEYESRR